MKLLDNVNSKLKDDLAADLNKGSKVSIDAAYFSIYAYQELKKQLESIEELRFIFTSPTFLKEKNKKESREFYIPRLNRERSIYGTEFEVKLRNEMPGFMNVDDNTYFPINGFTTVDLGCERGNNVYYPITKMSETENASYYLKLFENIWNDNKRI